MRLTRQDKLLLEELDSKYGKELLAATLMQIANSAEPEDSDQHCSPKEAVLNFIQFLEGARIRMREIHWETEKNSLHQLTNGYIAQLEDYEDTIAEDLMGICGFRIHVGEILPIMPESTDSTTLFKEIHKQTIALIVSLEGMVEFTGIINTLEDMAHELGKGEYLETMK